MKKTIITAGLAAVSLAALIGGAALAQQTQPALRHAQPVTQAEFVQARVSRLTALDTNHDGAVSTDERRARAETRRAERISKRFERLDVDKDGQVSRAEFYAARAPNGERAIDRANHRGPLGGQRHGQRMARHSARPGDAQPIARHGPVVIADVQSRLTEGFIRRDTNHDGVLSREERQAERTAMRERGGEHRARQPQAATSASPSAPASE